jgi:hypothetical protein
MANQLNEWRNSQLSFMLESLDTENQSLWNMSRRVIIIDTPSPLMLTARELDLSCSEKAKELARILFVQYKPVNDPWVSIFIEANSFTH